MNEKMETKMKSSSSPDPRILLRELEGASSDFEEENYDQPENENEPVEGKQSKKKFEHDVLDESTDPEKLLLETLSLKPTLSKKNADPFENRLFIDPTYKLDRSERFRISLSATPPGSILKLKMVKQYPTQEIDNKPLFELAELAGSYEEMEESMIQLYSSVESNPLIKYSQMTTLPKGAVVVLQSWKDADEEAENLEDSFEDIPVYKRIKFLGAPSGAHHLVKVEYIDYFTHMLIDSNSLVMYLDKSFAILPPRVCAIEMEGLHFYKDGFIQRFIRYDSDEYVFDGVLTAEVQQSGKVVIWSDRFPKEQFPYGINGFIIDSILGSINLRPILPSVGYRKMNGMVVHADKDGNISVQFDNPISKHFMDVFSSISETRIEILRGSVTCPQEEEIYLAPHSFYGSHYRAVISGPSSTPAMSLSNEDVSNQPEVHVQYLDYGDEAVVKVEDLVMAKDIHYVLSTMPQLYVKVHLLNIRSLEHEKYLELFHRNDEQYTVHVVAAAEPDKPAEVILKRVDKSGKLEIINKMIVEKGLAHSVDPLLNYTERFEDQGLQLAKWSLTPARYLGLEGGARVKVGDELFAKIKYDKCMPDSHFFMTPKSNVNERMKFTKNLRDLCKNLKANMPNKCQFRSSSKVPGLGVVCISEKLRKVARGILLKELDEIKVGSSQISSSSTSRWEVYLPDYGIVERCDKINLFNTKSDFVETPYFGCLAYHKELDSKEKLSSWWSTHSKKKRSEHDSTFEVGGFDLCTVKKYEYETESIRRKLKIISISNTPFGDVMEVEW